MKITEINVPTGEVLERNMTKAEIAAREAEEAARLAAETEKLAAKEALLAKLGITVEEANILLG